MLTTQKNILVIDDEKLVRDFLCTVLEKAGYTVSCAENGNRGLQLLKKDHFDIVITDMVMPDREGIETIGEISSFYPAIKIVAMSGAPYSKTFLQAAGCLGAICTIQKPFMSNEILDMLGGCCD